MKGYTAQDLSKFLTKAESDMSEKDFFAFVAKHQELDRELGSEDFTCLGRTFFNKNHVVIIGEHARGRSLGRAFLTKEQLIKLIDSQLNNPLVTAQLLSYRVCYDDDNNSYLGVDDLNVEAVAVVSENSDYVIVYEAGFVYIRVKTIWDKKDGVFFLNAKTKAIKINKNKDIETDVRKIYEVAPNTRN